MKESYKNHRQDDGLSRAIGISIGFHVALLAAFAIRVVLFPSEPLQIESAIRVDMVGLPDKGTKKALPPPTAEPPKAVQVSKPESIKPEPAKPEPVAEKAKPKPAPVEVAKPDAPTVNLNKAKQQQEAALKRLEALQKLERMATSESQNSVSGSSSATKASTTQSAPIKGNEIAHGSSLTGVARIDNQTYLKTINDHVKSHWNLPRWMSNANFKAVVRVFVDANGYVIKKEMIRSSNNETFDERVMAAIESSNPFPQPPDTLVNRLAVYGLDLGFPD